MEFYNYTNARQIRDLTRECEANFCLNQIAERYNGKIEAIHYDYIYEVGNSLVDFKTVCKYQYAEILKKQCDVPELVIKELMDIIKKEDSLFFFLVDFPKGQFRKCADEIFNCVKRLGYVSITLDDYNRSGRDIWGSYGFSGNYLTDGRIKIL